MVDDIKKPISASMNAMYHVWITSLLSSYEERIIHNLVQKGYTVSPADANGKLSLKTEGAVSSLMVLLVEKKVIDCAALLEDVRGIMDSNGMKYFSVIVSKYTANCTWLASNCFIHPKSAHTNQAVSKDEKKSN